MENENAEIKADTRIISDTKRSNKRPSVFIYDKGMQIIMHTKVAFQARPIYKRRARED